MSERLKESVLKTEVLIGIPGVRIPLHPRGHKFSLALSIDNNESDRLDWYDRWNGSLCYDLVRTLSPFRYLPLSLYRLGKGRVDYLWELSRRSRWSCEWWGLSRSFPGLTGSGRSGTRQWREKRLAPSDGSSTSLLTTDMGREFQLYLSIRQE